MTQATVGASVQAGTTPAPAGSGGNGAPVILRPFRVGVQEVDDDVYDQTVTLAASAVTLPQYNIPSTAFLRAVYLLAENVVTSNTATATSTSTGVGVFAEDAPWNVFDTFQFTDTNSSEIIGPVSGYDLFVITKWGGYLFQDDPRANPDIFASTSNATASSSAAGSFVFMLRIPVELVPRDSLGALPNKSASTPFKIKLRANTIANIYANSATVGGALRVRMMPDSYWQPTATDGSGNSVASLPPGVNTTQYWNVTPYTTQAGNFLVGMVNSTGFPVRNLGWVLRDSTPLRSTGETDFPDPFKMQMQTNILINRLKRVWKKKITDNYNYLQSGDGAGQKDNGLYWQPYNQDFAQKPGWETRRGYLRTSDGMRLEAKGTIGGSGAHTLTVYTNYIGIGQGSTLGSITT